MLGWRRFGRLLLALYALLLLALVCWCSPEAGRWQSLTIEAAPGSGLTEAVIQTATSVMREFALFLVLAFLVGVACGPGFIPAPRLQVLQSVALAFMVSSTIAVGTRTLLYSTPWAAPSFPALCVLTGVCMWGSWLGTTWLSAQRFGSWFFKQLFLATFLFVCGAVGFGWLALSADPLPIASAELSTEDRRRLFNMILEKDPRDLRPDEIQEIRLTESDCNQLTTWALSLLPGDHEGRVRLSDGDVSVDLSLQLPAAPILNRYINLKAAGDVTARPHGLGFAPRRLTLGRMTIPDWMLRLTGPITIGSEWPQEAVEPVFRSLRAVSIREDGATISYGHLDLKNSGIRQTLVDFGVIEDLNEATRAQMLRLIALAENRPSLTAAECVETAFAEARVRSTRGTAVRENRAAILTLGCLLGHSKLRMFAGTDLPAVSPSAAAVFRRITLRDRRDWTRHYFVSAALQVSSNTLASLDAGILKEELDAAGGSGFSFGDLLADRAGTLLAVRATESEAAAVSLQDRLAAGLAESDLLPRGDDLPEGLSDEQLNREFGGVGGVRYQLLLAEIDRRIRQCAAYQVR